MKTFPLYRSTWFALLTVGLVLALSPNLSGQDADSDAGQDDVEVILELASDSDSGQSSDEVAEQENTEQEVIEVRAVDGKGKIVIVDENGDRREIALNGTNQVIIVQSDSDSGGNGVREHATFILGPEGLHTAPPIQVEGRAIVVGPDGKQLKIDLSRVPNDQSAQLEQRLKELAKLKEMLALRKQDAKRVQASAQKLRSEAEQMRSIALGIRMKLKQSLPQDADENAASLAWVTGSLDPDQITSPFLIGVHCEPVGNALRDHLGLEEGVGLLVEKVWDDQPAGQAGLQQNDILIRADAQPLTDVATMVKAIDAAGKQNRSLSFTLIRKGKEMKLDIQPAKRKKLEGLNESVLRIGSNPAIKIDEIVPGMIIETEDNIDEGDKRFLDAALMKPIAAQLLQATKADKASIKKELKQLRQQMREMQSQMQELMEQIKKTHENAGDGK